MDKLIEAGIIVNTHGLRGEVRIQPWADSPAVLAGLERVFIDGAPIKVLLARVHKSLVIASLEGISDIDSAIKLKNKIVHALRDDIPLEEGRHYIADIIGLRAINVDTGEEAGTVAEVLSLPANNVYVIKGDREILVPVVPEFIVETNIDEGVVKIRLIEGM